MLLKPAKLEMAFLKMGIYGEAGSGKTFTASRVALGLYAHIKAKVPIAFIDTETGSDFLLPIFRKAKVQMHVAKSRAFKDLLQVMDEAEKSCSIIIVDSLTHFWSELIGSYMKKNEIKRLTLRHWQPLKAMWREFTDRYVNSKLHVIVCGRSADKWEEVEDPDDGSKELRKVGTKMRTETEMAYEPSLLVEMEAVQLSARAGGAMTHRAYVKKDRFDAINAATFDNPGFEAFLPHIQLLNLGGEHKALETGRDSTELFERPDMGERKILRREIALEKIENEIRKLYPGQAEKDKAARIALMETIFGTNSWREISTLIPAEKLQAGLNVLVAKSKATAGGDDLPAPGPAILVQVAQQPPADGAGKSRRKGART